jgi:hypothetical protein
MDDSKTGIDKYLKRNPNTCFVAIASGKIVGVILSGHQTWLYTPHSGFYCTQKQRYWITFG